jgi:AcrR family transcriptional regulator
MGRPRQYDDDDIFNAALVVLDRSGPRGLSLSAVCDAAGVPSGVIYNRFGDRDALVAALWLRTVRRFQEAFLERLRSDDLVEVAVWVVRWARAHPRDGAVLLLHRREDLFTTVSGDLGREARALAASLKQGLVEASLRSQGALTDGLTRLTFAVARIPEAAVRPYLGAHKPVPPEVDSLVRDAARGVLCWSPTLG